MTLRWEVRRLSNIQKAREEPFGTEYVKIVNGTEDSIRVPEDPGHAGQNLHLGYQTCMLA